MRYLLNEHLTKIFFQHKNSIMDTSCGILRVNSWNCYEKNSVPLSVQKFYYRRVQPEHSPVYKELLLLEKLNEILIAVGQLSRFHSPIL